MEKSPATYDQALEEMEKLQQLTKELKQAEIGAFLAEVKPKIIKYGLTAAQLGFTDLSSELVQEVLASKEATVMYKKGDFTWSGRGRRPQWMKDAKDAGEDLEQYRVK